MEVRTTPSTAGGGRRDERRCWDHILPSVNLFSPQTAQLSRPRLYPSLWRWPLPLSTGAWQGCPKVSTLDKERPPEARMDLRMERRPIPKWKTALRRPDGSLPSPYIMMAVMTEAKKAQTVM
ncbi:hypothetical protein SRHO_G00255100 [Serrasalmus rhombeus]